ncbi:MAG: hypothetical protein KDE48_22370 [Anaerolineales bacterium]|nr:hypothetical protein [Anaerolineales bacterium]
MVYTYEYDTTYHGPALPVVELEIAAAGEWLTLDTLVDSGADCNHDPNALFDALRRQGD